MHAQADPLRNPLDSGANNEHFTSSSLLIVANRAFSVSVGLAILYFKTKQDSSRGTFSQRLRPASPLFA